MAKCHEYGPSAESGSAVAGAMGVVDEGIVLYIVLRIGRGGTGNMFGAAAQCGTTDPGMKFFK